MKTIKFDKEAILDYFKKKEGIVQVLFEMEDEVYEDCEFGIYVLYDASKGVGTAFERDMESVEDLDEYLNPEGVDTGITIIHRPIESTKTGLDSELGDLRILNEIGE